MTLHSRCGLLSVTPFKFKASIRGAVRMSSTDAQSVTPGSRQPLPKKLIICCDGTWKNSSGAWYNLASFSFTDPLAFFKKSQQLPTNITRLTRAIRPTDTRTTSPTRNHAQIIFYQAGVGTSGTLLNRIIGGATGAGLAENIREAYAFVATNYVQGDEVFLFGFSRGAYTARAVGGLIGDMGLLKKDSMDRFFDVYSDWNFAGKKGYTPLLASTDPTFKTAAPAAPKDGDIRPYLTAYRDFLRKAGYTTTKPVTITAIGVFETVGALGIPVSPTLQRLGWPTALHSYRFYDTALSSSGHVLNAFQALALDEHRSAYTPAIWEKPVGVSTTLKQAWFPGAHSGVGGGYADTGLADITLAWMMSQLSPWIDFEPGYIEAQHAANISFLKKEDVPATGLQWAAGQLHDTAAGIRGLLGTATRTPGAYTAVAPTTGRPIEGDLLRDTGETIHISVRSRMVTGGLDSRNRMRGYAPKAMKGYELEDPDAELGKGVWRYVGTEKELHGKTLEEEPLGVFEKGIFEEASKMPAAVSK